jgi:hypothetical protein
VSSAHTALFTSHGAEEARANVRDAEAAGVDPIKLVYDDMGWLRNEPMVVM